MEEVQRQLTPLSENVHRLDKRLCSLYSNGSGGPPGALEIWRAEDKKTFESILEAVDGLKDSRDLADKFIATVTVRQERWDRVWSWIGRHWWKAASAVVTALLGIGGIAYHEAAPVVKVLIEDYVRSHPQLGSELKKVSTNIDPVIASRQKSLETSDLPPSYDPRR